MSQPESRNSLKSGHQLHWYEIVGILGQGGFGITYLGHDPNLDQAVAIKEYLPMELAVREVDHSVYPASTVNDERYQWGLERFISEARTLARFKHPAIVRVLSVFEENNTAYMVMEYERGESLQQILTRRTTLTEAELVPILSPLLDGLELIHASGFIHRDIKPANIYIRDDQTPVLLDFGSARQSLDEQTKSLTSIVSPGYAPFEQYYSKSDRQGPWTDIYALAATMYRAISGVMPMNAIDRSEAILQAERDVFVSASDIGEGRYSKTFVQALDHALNFSEKKRPQSIAQWRKEFGFSTQTYKATTRITNPPLASKKGSPPTLAVDETETVLGEPPMPSVRNDDLPRPAINRRDDDARPEPVSVGRGASVRRILALTTFVIIAVLVGWRVWTLPPDFIASVRDTVARFVSKTEQPKNETLIERDIPSAVQENVDLADIPDGAGTQFDLDLAAADLRSGRLVNPEESNALARYRAILQVEPNNEQALSGIDNVVAALSARFDSALNDLDFSGADALLESMKDIGIDGLRGRSLDTALFDARSKAQRVVEREAAIENLLAQAAADLRANRLLSPAEGNATDRYNQVLVLDPGNSAATHGLRAIAENIVSFARTAIEQGEFDSAREYLRRAGLFNDSSATVAQLSEQLDLAEQAAQQADAARKEARDIENRRAAERQRQRDEQSTRTPAAAASQRETVEAPSMAEPEPADTRLTADQASSKQSIGRATLAVEIDGFDPRYESFGLQQRIVRADIEERLRALGYELSSTSGSQGSMLPRRFVIKFRANLHNDSGVISYATALLLYEQRPAAVESANPIVQQPIWNSGAAGVAQRTELARVREEYSRMMERFTEEIGRAPGKL